MNSYTASSIDTVRRYEQLQQELRTAQERAVEEAEEAELAQAAAAVARLTAPRLATAGGSVEAQGDDAAARVRRLQEAVLQAEDTLLTDAEEEGDAHGRSEGR